MMAALGLAVLLLGHATFTLRVLERDPASIAYRLTASDSLLDVEGTIVTPPRVERAQRGRMAAFAWYAKPVTRFELAADRTFDEAGLPTKVTGRIWVRVGEGDAELRAGQRIRVLGMASLLEGPGNPGEKDTRLRAEERGIAGRMRVDSRGTLSLLPARGIMDDVTRLWLGGISDIRSRARHWLEEGAEDDPSRALLVGLLLGETSDSMRELTGAFSRVGLAHVLSVSGFHLIAFVGTLVLIIRLHGEHPRVEPLLVAASVLVYLVLIPAQAPIVRAGVMTLGLLLSESAGRRYDRLNTLALVLAAIVIWRPMELWDIGCQLSFLSVAALIVFARPLRERLFGERRNRDELAPFGVCLEWFKDALAASIAAWLFTAPLVAYHLGVVSPLAPLATLVTLPLGILVIGLGYAAVVMGLLLPWIADPARWLIDGGAEMLAGTVLWIDTLPGSVNYLRGAGASAAWTIGAMLVIGWWMTRASPRRMADIAALAALAVWTIVRFTSFALPSNMVFRMDSLDVGDGSCHLLRSGDDAVMFDCGSSWYAIGERVIPMAVRALHAPAVRTVVVSHADIDHFAGLLDVARPLGVRRVLVSESFQQQAVDNPDGAAAFVSRGLLDLGVKVETVVRGDEIKLGQTTLRVLGPSHGSIWDSDNEGSLIIKLTIPTSDGQRGVLLCGDVAAAGIASIRAAEPSLHAEIMEAPHHGSARSDAIEWVRDVDPLVVVQSTGPSRIDDPRWEKVRAGRECRTTATGGAIWVQVARDGAITTGQLRKR